KNIQLGIRGDSETQITSGVSANESVITSGGYGLPDKTKIKIEAAPAKEEDAADKSNEKSPDKSSERSTDKPPDKAPKKSNDKTKPSGAEKE
ncbi:MAG TPA: hypothetical protein VH598_00920, partial [Verrucomicrobiae bacterium]|nr:hypothetical protein [Verrucomicrobiae bacterium]